MNGDQIRRLNTRRYVNGRQSVLLAGPTLEARPACVRQPLSTRRSACSAIDRERSRWLRAVRGDGKAVNEQVQRVTEALGWITVGYGHQPGEVREPRRVHHTLKGIQPSVGWPGRGGVCG